MDMANRLRQQRKSIHLTQAQLAEKAGMTQQMIQQLETRKVLTTGKLVALAEALGVRPKWLETGEEPMIDVVTADERELLEDFRAMDKEEREAYRLLFKRRRKERITIIDPPLDQNHHQEDEQRAA